MTKSSGGSKGVPIRDRSEGDIRKALENHDDAVITAALKLWKYAREENVGVTKLAMQVGTTTGVLSPWFNGEYVGDSNAVAKEVEKFFWRLEQKALYGGIREFRETRLARGLWLVFDKTRVTRRIQPVEGPAQIGKSRAATEYTDRNNNHRTVYQGLSGGTKAGLGDFQWALAQTLGIPYTIKLREKKLRIRESLEVCDLFIIDWAHLVFSWPDSVQEDFWDYVMTDIHADGQRGIVLIFTDCDFLRNLQNWRKPRGYNIGQLMGRLRNDVVQIDAQEDICEEDVRMLVERYYSPGKAAFDRLYKIAIQPDLGHYGLICDVMNEAWSLAKGRKTKLTDDIVNRVIDKSQKIQKDRKELYE